MLREHIMPFWDVSVYAVVAALFVLSSAADVSPWATQAEENWYKNHRKPSNRIRRPKPLPEWVRQNQEEWPKNYPECGGSQQSPIFIDPKKTEKWTPGEQRMKFEMEFDYFEGNFERKLTAFNNGFNYNANYSYPQPQFAPIISVRQYGVTTVYILMSSHIRWPAEHTVIGPYPHADLEIQFKYKNERNRLLFLTYMYTDCDIQSDPLEEEELAAGKIKIADTSTRYSTKSLRAMPKDYTCGYFMYNGSLTNPPCTEEITWLIFKRILCMDAISGMKKFRSMKNAEGRDIYSNARFAQDINGRTVVDLSCANYD